MFVSFWIAVHVLSLTLAGDYVTGKNNIREKSILSDRVL